MRVMTLPAKISLFVGGQIDLWSRYHLRILTVALSTKLSSLWLCRSYDSWREFVFLRHSVTGRALKQDVMRDCLCSCNFGMARSAFPRGFKGFGIMGVMALDTGTHWIVGNGIDLWEPSRPGWIVGMTEGAEFSAPRRPGFDLEIPDVFLGRTVTCLAGESEVVSLALLAGFFHMAVRANAGSGKCDLPGYFPLDRRLLMKVDVCQGSGEQLEEGDYGYGYYCCDNGKSYDGIRNVSPGMFHPNSRKMQAQHSRKQSLCQEVSSPEATQAYLR